MTGEIGLWFDMNSCTSSSQAIWLSSRWQEHWNLCPMKFLSKCSRICPHWSSTSLAVFYQEQIITICVSKFFPQSSVACNPFSCPMVRTLHNRPSVSQGDSVRASSIRSYDLLHRIVSQCSLPWLVSCTVDVGIPFQTSFPRPNFRSVPLKYLVLKKNYCDFFHLLEDVCSK